MKPGNLTERSQLELRLYIAMALERAEASTNVGHTQNAFRALVEMAYEDSDFSTEAARQIRRATRLG